MLHCVYTDQTAQSHVHIQAARDSLICALVCTIGFDTEATSCTRFPGACAQQGMRGMIDAVGVGDSHQGLASDRPCRGGGGEGPLAAATPGGSAERVATCATLCFRYQGVCVCLYVSMLCRHAAVLDHMLCALDSQVVRNNAGVVAWCHG